MRRVVGVLIAVAALAGAAASQRGVDESRKAEAREAAGAAAGVAGKRAEEALRSFLRGEETRALAAAAMPQVRNMLGLLRAERLEGTLTTTLADSFQNEPEWAAYRRAYPIYAVSSEAPDLELVMGSGKAQLSAKALVSAARDKSVGSGLVSGGGRLYAAAAAPVPVPGRSMPAVILLAKPMDDALVKELSGAAGAALLLVDARSRTPLARAGTVDELAELIASAAAGPGAGGTVFTAPAGDSAAAALAVAPGFTLWAHADAGVTARASAGAARTTRIGIWSVGSLIALVALIYGLRPLRAPASPVPAQASLPATRVASPRAPLVEAGTPAPAPVSGTSTLGSPSGYSQTEIAGRTPPARTPVAGGFGRYTLIDRLGEGGMSQVYTAVVFGAEGFRRRFVIKRLRPELLNDPAVVAQFIDEANMASSLVHSNIVPVLDFGKVNDEYFLATEYILGRDLSRVTRHCFDHAGTGMPLPAALFAAHETLKALEYAHTRTGDGGRPLGIVHRDVSPNNVLVSSRGEVKLFDFGIVKAEGRVTRTEHGVVKGNVSFMSPEQARGQAVDPRADIFSMGLVLFYCLTGDVLYSGTTSYELLLKAATGPGPEEQARIRALPAPANALVARALAVDPGQRFASAGEFATAVLPHVGQGSGQLATLMHQSFGEEFRWEEQRFASAVPENPASSAPGPGGSQTSGARRS
jgi:hypothetical protein